MDICLGYRSALEAMLDARSRPPADHSEPSLPRPPGRLSAAPIPRGMPGCRETGLLIPGSVRVARLEMPIDVLISDASARVRNDVLAPHVWAGAIPRGGIVDLGDGLLSCSPEFALLQVAPSLDALRLLALAYEMCGTFAFSRDDSSPSGVSIAYDVAPLTNAARLGEFLLGCERLRGVAAVRACLRHLADGSPASPMEVRVVLALCLPGHRGGFGLPLPVLNHPLPIPKELRAMAGCDFYRCDLYWPAACLDVEYDSDAHHGKTQDIERDARRRNVLQEMGVTVISITREQARDPEALEMLAQAISRRLGHRRRQRVAGLDARRDELMRGIFGRPGALGWRERLGLSVGSTSGR